MVESVGEGVTNFAVGDHVIPLFLPQCQKCPVCVQDRGNFCFQFMGMQMKGLMPDGTSRMHSVDGQTFHTFMGCGTFSEYTVVPEMNLVKINPKAKLESVCLIGCGVTTGYGAGKICNLILYAPNMQLFYYFFAAVNTAKVRPGSSCAVFGLGAVGLSTVIGCKNAGAARIFAVDINDAKEEVAKKCGATEFINPTKLDIPIADHLKALTGFGVENTFEAVGITSLMRQAIDCTAAGFGTCVLIGVPPTEEKLEIRPAELQVGKSIKGTVYGCYRGEQIPQLVEDYVSGKLQFDVLITHKMGLDKVNDAFDLLKSGKSIRSVIHM